MVFIYLAGKCELQGTLTGSNAAIMSVEFDYEVRASLQSGELVSVKRFLNCFVSQDEYILLFKHQEMELI